MRIDAQFGDFEFFENVRGSSNFCKIWTIILNLHTNILYQSRNFSIEFSQNR